MDDLTKTLRPYFKAIRQNVKELEYYIEEYQMVPFDIDEEDADALRWLQENVFV